MLVTCNGLWLQTKLSTACKGYDDSVEKHSYRPIISIVCIIKYNFYNTHACVIFDGVEVNQSSNIFTITFQLAKMVNNRVPSVFSKTYVTPRRPFEKARLDQELKIIGEYGLRNKREVWRVKYTLARIRKAARELLTLEEKDPKRLFEGKILLIFHATSNIMAI